MKMVLINPPISGHNERDLFESEPLGIAYLCAILEREKIDVDVLDCFARGIKQVYPSNGFLRKGLTDPQIKEALLEMKPDYIGIHSNFTMFFPDARDVALLAREILPDVPIIFGGAHATMEAAAIVDNAVADIVVRGEAEVTVVELLRALESGLPLDGVLGITFKDATGKVQRTADRPLLQDIDALPMPAWHKIDMDIYIENSKESSPFSMQHPTASLITSRGCPFDCVFCSTKVMWKRKWRPDSPEKVVAEIEHLVKEYGVKEIIIQDDNFITDKRRVHKICDMLIEKDLGISLHDPAGLTVWTVDEKLLEKMKEAGFYRVLFPVESGSSKTMEFVNKPVKLDKVLETVKIANKLGYWTQSNFIVGFPYETREDILTTVRYAFNSGFDFAAFLIAQPFAGAEMYNIFKREGLLKEESMEKRSIFLKTQFDTKHLKGEEIQKLRDWAASRYVMARLLTVLNPFYFFTYFWPKINSWRKFKYFVRINLSNFDFIFNRYRKSDIKQEKIHTSLTKARKATQMLALEEAQETTETVSKPEIVTETSVS